MGWSSLQSFSLHASKSCGWSFWYLFSVESRVRCWRKQLKNTTFFHESYLSCESYNSTVQSFLNHSCPITDRQNIGDLEAFNFGMFIEALKSRVVESTTDFHHKFFYCFWWGLRSLSSVGQGLETSTYVGEIIFALSIAVSGLVLFASLIGNMQKYLQSPTVRVEEMRIKRQRDCCVKQKKGFKIWRKRKGPHQAL
ncbi:hypothetical protein PHAVU_010G113332 [Phaseolus vulgaris]